jgi:hypothetical protein
VESIWKGRDASAGHLLCAWRPACGATVFYSTQASPGVVAIPVGAFADPSFPAPTRSVWEERQHSWLRLPDDIEHVS